MKKVVATLTTTLNLSVPDGNLDSFRQALNQHYTGMRSVPMGKEVPQKLKDAHWHLNAVCVKRVKFTVYSDGTYDCEILNESKKS